MERTEIIEKLKEIVKPYITEPEVFAGLNENSHLLRDLKINSAHLIDIVLDVETAFDVRIEDDAMDKMATVGDVVDIIAGQKK